MNWLLFIIVIVLVILVIGISIYRIMRPRFLDTTVDMQDQIKAAQMEMLKPTESAAKWLMDLDIDPFSIKMEFVPDENIFGIFAETLEDKQIDLSIDCGPCCMLGKIELASVEIGDDGEGNSTLVVSTKRSNWWKVKKSWPKRLYWWLFKKQWRYNK